MNDQSQIPQLALTAIYKIIEEEGGFVYTDHPVDPDQGTYAGIRFNVFKIYTETRHGVINPVIFREMALSGTLKEYVLGIYYRSYFLNMELLSLPSRLIMPVLSCGVNCGTRKSIKILQKTCNEVNTNSVLLTVDGFNGIKTSNLVHKLCIHIDDTNMENSREFTNEFRNNFVKNWIHYYCKVVSHNHKNAVFIVGWFNRANKYWVTQCG